MADEAVRAELASQRTIDLTTTGARSGRPSRIEIWGWMIDGRYVITGTPGPRDWYANVLNNPRVIVHLPGGDLAGVADPVRDEQIRHRVFTHPDTAWYRIQTSLEDLVDNAPMIEVTFGD